MTTASTFDESRPRAADPSTAPSESTGIGDSLQRLLLQAVSEARGDLEQSCQAVAQVIAIVLRPDGIWRCARVEGKWSVPKSLLGPRSNAAGPNAASSTGAGFEQPCRNGSQPTVPPETLALACDEAIARGVVVHMGQNYGLPFALLACPGCAEGKRATGANCDGASGAL